MQKEYLAICMPRRLRRDCLRHERFSEPNTQRLCAWQAVPTSPLHSGVAKRRRGVPLGMHRMNPEYLDPDSSDRAVTADILLRQEPDEDENEEEEDEDEGDDKEEDDEESDDGYSE
jgi:hypothetical protein